MNRNMTIPSRPAPPPPQAASNKVTRYSPATNWDDTPFNPQSSSSANTGMAMPITRQPPMVKKAPPPRPPPPKVVPALKKPGQQQSINILSNLFGQKRSSGSSKSSAVQKSAVPMKLPPPPKLPPPLGGNSHYGSIGSTAHSSSMSAAANGSDAQLISFDSPPSSPTFTQKSCSDCISVDSFSSDSNYSSPNNGNMSQAESGFEDDFVSQNEHLRSKTNTPSSVANTPSSSGGTAAMRDLWDLSDPFGMPPPVTTTKPASSANSSHYAPLSSATIRAPAVNSKLYDPEFVDPLCNGKTVAPKVQTVAMPTIIKAAPGLGSQKSTPVHNYKPALAAKPTLQPPLWSVAPKPAAPIPPTIVPATPSVFLSSTSSSNFVPSDVFDDDDDAEESLDSLPSPPMPNIPPPPPPPCVADEDDDLGTLSSGLQLVLEEPKEPYGIAMYDFAGETDEDLSFRMDDKIYLLKRLNDEWLYGRDRRGCEGMFPVNYIDVKVPLPEDRLSTVVTSPAIATTTTTINKNKNSDISHSGPVDSFSSKGSQHPKVRVLYTFNAETAEDLTITENDLVTVLAQITPEWLYGELHGQRGQFPANFIEYVPPNLPPMSSASGGGL